MADLFKFEGTKISKPLLDEQLECTICLEFPVSPIYNCKDGHVTCGICYDKVSECALCREDLIICGLAERFVRRENVMLDCRNKGSGCLENIRSCEMTDHMTKCSYRPIKCFIRDSNQGRQVFYQGQCDPTTNHPIESLYSHLKNVHKIEDLSPEGMAFSGIQRWSYSTSNLSSMTRGPTLKAFHGQGKSFLLHIMNESPIVYWWVTLIGADKESNYFSYIAEFVAGTDIDISKRIKLTWQFPVLPITEYSDFTKVLSTGKLICVHENLLNLAGATLAGAFSLRSWKIILQIKSSDNQECYTDPNPFTFAWKGLPKLSGVSSDNGTFPQSNPVAPLFKIGIKTEPMSQQWLKAISNNVKTKAGKGQRRTVGGYVPLLGTDTIMSNGSPIQIITRHQAINKWDELSEYKLSFEESRYYYYQRLRFVAPLDFNLNLTKYGISHGGKLASPKTVGLADQLDQLSLHKKTDSLPTSPFDLPISTNFTLLAMKSIFNPRTGCSGSEDGSSVDSTDTGPSERAQNNHIFLESDDEL